MYRITSSSGELIQVEILPMMANDFKAITKKRYYFNWKLEKDQEVYKLRVLGSTDILGLISIERIPTEWSIHVRLLTVSVENKGASKNFDGIAANLLTHIAKMAVDEHGVLACVSLTPKSNIAEHYIKKYKMRLTGKMLSLEVPEIINLIKRYDHE